MKKSSRRGLSKTSFGLVVRALVGHRFIVAEEQKSKIYTRLKISCEMYRSFNYSPTEAAFHFAGLNRLKFNKSNNESKVKPKAKEQSSERTTEELS